MGELPVLSGKELVQALQRAGFSISRQRGSHCQLRHRDGRRATVPVHGSEDMPRGTLHGILKDIGLNAEELRKFL